MQMTNDERRNPTDGRKHMSDAPAEKLAKLTGTNAKRVRVGCDNGIRVSRESGLFRKLRDAAAANSSAVNAMKHQAATKRLVKAYWTNSAVFLM